MNANQSAEQIIEKMKRARVVEEFLWQMFAHPDEDVRWAAAVLLRAAVQRGAEAAKRDFETFERATTLAALSDLQTVKPEGSA